MDPQVNQLGGGASIGTGLPRLTRGEVAPYARRGEESTQPFQRREERPDRLGFGQDSVSIPKIAVRTIDRNLRAAGELVPSVEELRAEAAERRVREAAREKEEAPRITPHLDVRVGIAGAVENTRTFVNSIDEAARRAGERSPQGPAERPSRLDVRIGGNAFELQRPPGTPTVEFFA